MDTSELFKFALSFADDAIDLMREALHFELLPGGYWDSMLTVCDIGDDDAVMHYVDIAAGLPGKPTTFLASYSPENLAAGLDAFFKLGKAGQPLYYNGTFNFRVESRADLIRQLCNAFCQDDDDDEARQEIVSICGGERSIRAAEYRSVNDAHKETLASLDDVYGGDLEAFVRANVINVELASSNNVQEPLEAGVKPSPAQ